MERTTLAIRIHDLILRLQRKRRFVALSRGIGPDQVGESLNYVEEAILIYLGVQPDRNVKEVAQVLKLERSWVSRIVVGLEERGLLRAFVPEVDKRSKKLRVTAKGKETLARLQKTLTEIVELTLQPLNAEERETLLKFYRGFADALKAPTFLAHSGGHPFDIELLRLSWILGFHGSSFLGGELSVTQVHILIAMDETKSGDIVISDLDKVLPFDMSTISRAVENFRQRGAVEKIQSDEDKRSYFLHLTAEGRALLSAHRKLATAMFTESLREMSLPVLSKVAELLDKATSEMPLVVSKLKEEVEIRRLSSKQELALTQDFLAESGSEAASDATAQLLRETYGFFCADTLRGAARVYRRPGSLNVERFVVAAAALTPENSLLVLKSCLKGVD